MPLRPDDPARIGQYALEGVLGTGGMGVVFLARAPDGRRVAVKSIRADLRGDPSLRTRFAREVSAATRVAGFCTAPVLDADTHGPVPYLVTEYVPGPSLHDHVERHGPLSAPDLSALAVGVAAGLTAIHAVGLAHGDLTPRNVLLSPMGPKLIDFGVASLLDQAGNPQSLFGTPGWLAPERAAGQPAGQPGDVFAWGLLIAWAGTGRLVTAAGDRTAAAPQILTRLPGHLVPAVSRALRPDPRDRPSARELMLSLVEADRRDSYRAAVAPSATRPRPTARPAVAPTAARPPTAGPTTRFEVPGRRLVRGWIIGLGVIVAAVGAGVAMSRATDPGGPGGGDRPAATAGARTAARPGGNAAPTAPAASGKPSGGSSALVRRDGSLEFRVSAVRCGLAELGTWPLVRKASGRFCVIDVTVANSGSSDAFVWVNSQRVVDADGNTHRVDNWAYLYYPQTRQFLRALEPGGSLTGSLVYDIPAGARLTRLVVYETPLSRGTAIELTPPPS